ncbi:hypothetical protein ACH4LE_32210 [Streptomyces sp. NPDC017413]|uniref:hypothetical protein n=1 Tax=Streptomyces sp. NPDC017413 TaxID=3364994 RepID=UPI0037971CCB
MRSSGVGGGPTFGALRAVARFLRAKHPDRDIHVARVFGRRVPSPASARAAQVNANPEAR